MMPKNENKQKCSTQIVAIGNIGPGPKLPRPQNRVLTNQKKKCFFTIVDKYFITVICGYICETIFLLTEYYVD